LIFNLSANSISGQYEDVYALYNHDADFKDECMDGNHFAFFNEQDELIGYMCFGVEARIPASEETVYSDDYLDVGLHIKPNFTGKKLGSVFMKTCIDFALTTYHANRLRATIASFNQRAIKLCLNNGFNVLQEITHRVSGVKFTVVTSIL
jgi:RimJ/RimL family protein N-acetyltransferase